MDAKELMIVDESPADFVRRNTEMATVLGKLIQDRKLYKVIQDRKYVMVEGWTTLGGMIGVLPREVEVKRLEDGGYEAIVELVHATDGLVIGRASALCGMDEKTWASRPEYARRSMAVTRATGKAYRLGFSWIVKLAGYEATPAEEMPIEGEVHELPEKWTESGQERMRVPQKATSTDFWKAVKAAKLTQAEGTQILKELGGDFDKALDAVEQMTPPADERE
jgi:hypothetical protein